MLVSWSSGKDSAWALHRLRMQPERYELRGIFTMVTMQQGRVATQATPRRVLALQAERLALPLYEIPIPYPCPNAVYEAALDAFLARVRALPPELGASTLAFGDLFLEDIRRYREQQLSGSGFEPIFPVWLDSPGRTRALAEEMIASGLRALVTVVNPELAPAEIAGRWFDRALLDDLPAEVDALGENGEFHTCVLDGPMFTEAIVGRAAAADSAERSAPREGAHPAYVYTDVELE